MRLTLRTLLAYHDQVLAPVDQQDLHHRIQQNADAAELLRRIDALTTQSQLYSPALTLNRPLNELGEDPNSVSEYLDDVLYGPKVPEFERICLESNVHLAELAHCHELLATGLHTQVIVPTTLRELAMRVVDPNQRPEIERGLLTRGAKSASAPQAQTRILSATEEEHSGRRDSIQVSAPMVASGGESIRPEGLSLEDSRLSSEVPEYLMGSSRRRWKTPLAIGCLAMLMFLLVWQALGPWEKLRGMFLAGPSQADLRLGTDRQQGMRDPADAERPAESLANVPSVSEEGLSAAPVDKLPSAGSGQEEAASIGEEPAAPSQPNESTGKAAPSSVEPLGELPSVSDAHFPHAKWTPNESGSGHVLLVKRGDQLALAAVGEDIASGVQLLCLPNTREDVSLPGGILATLYGPTQLSIDTANSPTVINSELCRLLLKLPLETSLSFKSPLGRVRVEPRENDSRISVEVGYRRVTHGSVVDRKAYVPVQVILAAEGSATIAVDSNVAENQEASAYVLSIGEGLALVEGQRPAKFRLTDIPSWLRQDQVRAIDAIAVEDFIELAHSETAATLIEKLASIAGDRRPETAGLAIQASILGGDWQPLVNQLFASDRLRSHWRSTLDLARQLLAADASSATAVRELFIEKNGLKQGSEMFQMLIGLPEDQLAADGLAILVSQLESETLANRVLAGYELESVTGRDLAYQAHSPNRASIQQWRRDAATKRLSAMNLGDPITERLTK